MNQKKALARLVLALTILVVWSGCDLESVTSSLSSGLDAESSSTSSPSNGDKLRMVAVGYGGRRLSTDDGLSWENPHLFVAPTEMGLDDDNNLRGVGYGDGLFVAVGGGPNASSVQMRRVLTSSDGAQWVSQIYSNYGWIGDVDYTASTYFAAGGNGAQMRGVRDTSTLGGILWTSYWGYSIQNSDVDHLLGPTPHSFSGHVRRMAAGDGLFVMVGDNGRRSVTRGTENAAGRIQWVSHQTSGTTRRDVAFGLHGFVAVGDNGLRESSTDGINWSTHSSTSGWRSGCPSPPSNVRFRKVLWDGNQYIALSEELSGQTYVAKSSDGTSWTWHTTNQEPRTAGVLNQLVVSFHGWSTSRIYRGVITPGNNACGNPDQLLTFDNQTPENIEIWSGYANTFNDAVVGSIR